MVIGYTRLIPKGAGNKPPAGDATAGTHAAPEVRRGAPQGAGKRFSRHRIWEASLAALVTLGVLWVILYAQPAKVRHRHVLVISIDGMRSDTYLRPLPGLHIPNLLRLKQQGSFADGMIVVYPSLTYPSHTTMMTGKLPAQHGIYTNLSSRVPGKDAKDWFWFSHAIRCPTVWDVARRHGLTTASIGWPVTAGADINWDVPEIWNPAIGRVPEPMYVAKFMNPIFALQALGAVGLPKANEDDDDLRIALARYVIQEHQPNLMLIHLVDLDAMQHQYGPGSPQAVQVLNSEDHRIGEILAAYQKAGLGKNTDVFIVSDHGFVKVHRIILPNKLFVKAGLLSADAHGNITGGRIDTVSNDGSFFIYWPPHRHLGRAVYRAILPLLERHLVWAVLGRNALKALGADPNARLALDAPSGAMFDSSAKGPLVSSCPTKGSHGYLPFRPGLEASFIAWGPGIKSGVDLHLIRETSIASTILKALGIIDPKFGDTPPLQDIWKRPAARPHHPHA